MLVGYVAVQAATPIGDTPVKDTSHPRILLRKGEEKALMKNIGKDSMWTAMHDQLIAECDKICTQPVTEIKFDQNNKTMLSSARETLRKIFILSYGYRMTNNDNYFVRAEQEMLDKAALPNWNHKTFLDAAEMSLGMAIGYDWLYDKLSPDSRAKISSAIINYAMKPAEALGNKSWVKGDNNWNQVCHASMALSGLAIMEVDPKLGMDAINRADTLMKYSLVHYAPEGVYPEGPGYWSYGTSFNVMYLSTVEKYFGVESEQVKTPGFMQSAEFTQYTLTPTLGNFSYCDTGTKGSFSGTVLWFYSKTHNPALLYMQKRFVKEQPDQNYASQRLFPAVMIWGAGNRISLAKAEMPTSLFYCAKGVPSLATMRANWDKRNALFVGFKAGMPGVSHGHMDVGEFVMEIDGVKWSTDLGMDSYHNIETYIKAALWNRSQDSPRWDVFRYNNKAHSTLTINGQKQLVNATAEIQDRSADPMFMYAVSDLTPVYANDVAKAVRGVAMIDKKYVMVEDKITANDKPASVRWSMMTTTQDAKIDQSSGIITLTKNGKTLTMKIVAEGAKLGTWSAKPTDYDPAKTYENPNKGHMIVGFDVEIPAGATRDFKVYLLPGKTANEYSSKLTERIIK